MVYPQNQLVFDSLGEYSFNSMGQPGEDTFFMDFNGYYGVTRKFSFQVGVSSSEKVRVEFKIDEYGIKGVYNLISKEKSKYYLDIILAHHGGLVEQAAAWEFSAPNILYKKNNIFVVHPVVELVTSEQETEYSIGGHLGFCGLASPHSLIPPRQRNRKKTPPMDVSSPPGATL